MGAWGIKNFENDAAMDWLTDLQDEPTYLFIEATLKKADNKNYIEADDGGSILAAAEILAAKKGNQSVDFPKEVFQNISGIMIDDNIISRALLSIEKIIQENNSELYDLWLEAGELEKWVEVINNLKHRLLR